MRDKHPQPTDQDSDTFFGPWLRRRRRELDLTQDALAQSVGCVADTVRKLEAGMRRPSRAMAERLALCLVIPAEQHDAFLDAARAGRTPPDSEVIMRTAPTTAVPAAEPTPDATSPHSSRLPAPMTSFIGRAWEITTVAARLRTPDVRLVTLTGAGGIGKTRLALRIASGLHDAFPNGVWFVDLAPISDPALVISTIAQTLRVREQPGVPIAETLRAALHQQQLLLLLDNFEQVVVAAPELAALLAEVPKLKVLVTSREALHLYGEHIVVVAPLAVPDPAVVLAAKQLAEYVAAQLFVARAQAASDQFRLTDANAPAVAAICARLDGLPLAIELAAAQIPLFPPTALLTRLEQRLPFLTRGPRDLPARQQTLRDTIAWSYDLLTEAEQALFRRLSVFVGGGTLEAAEGVCNTDHDLPVEVMDGLAVLVDKSLLKQAGGATGEPRFTMLETIRAYALERLAASRETEALRRRHAQYFLALVEQARPQMEGSDQATWLNHLEREHDNLRAVLAWSLSEQGEVDVGLRLAMVVGRWALRLPALAIESYEWLERALQHIRGDDTPPAALRARLLYVLGSIVEQSQGDSARATRLLEESLALFRALGDRTGMADALVMLGRAARDQGDFVRAETLAQQSLALSREEQNPQRIALAIHSLGDVALDQGDTEQAAARFQEAVVLSRSAGDRVWSGWALCNLGRIAYVQGDFTRAMTILEETLALFRELGDQGSVPQVLLELGRVARAQGDAVQAAALFAESLALLWELRVDQRDIAYDLEGLGGAAARGQPIHAARLLGAAAALREAIGVPIPPVSRAEYERDVAAVRAQLDEATFAAAWAAGRGLSLEQAVTEALGDA